MKKSNLIITLAVALILAVSSVGAVLAASGVFAAGTDAPAAGTLGALTFSAESGIRWNEGNNAFEIFDAAGVSYISSNFWINATGGYEVSTKYNSTTGPAAGYQQATPLRTYHIMNDIVYTDAIGSSAAYNTAFKTTAPNLGQSGSAVSVGVLDGKGYSLVNFPVRAPAVLFTNVYGTIKDLTIDVGNVEVSIGGNFGTFCLYLHGYFINCASRGNLKTLSTQNVAGVVFQMEKTALMFNSSSFINLSSQVGGSLFGMVRFGYGKLVRCVNYGNLTGGGNTWGIGYLGSTLASAIDCANYGNIKVVNGNTGTLVSGLFYVSVSDSAIIPIVSCVNYGVVSTDIGTACGIAVSSGDAGTWVKTIANQNYGEITGSSAWQLYQGFNQ